MGPPLGRPLEEGTLDLQQGPGKNVYRRQQGQPWGREGKALPGLLLLRKLESLIFTEMSSYLNNEILSNSASHSNAWVSAHHTDSLIPAGCPATSVCAVYLQMKSEPSG